MKMFIAISFFIFITFSVSTIFAQPCNVGAGRIHVKPSKLDFGEVPVGSVSRILTFKINDLDGEVMTVSEISPGTPEFKIVSSPSLPFCIEGDEKVSIGVQFIPDLATRFISRIRIESTGGTAFIEVTGTGVAGEANLKVNPGSIDFGEVAPGKISRQDFTITNEGAASVTISRISSSNSAFRVTSPRFPRSLSPRAMLAVTAQFSPNKNGDFQGTLSIVVNSKTAASVAVSGSSKATPEISISPQVLSYGSMDVGTFKIQNMTISNSGQGDLQVILPSDPLLKSTPSNALNIKPNKSAQVSFKFIADKSGVINRKYTILSNDPDESRVQFTVTATGRNGTLGFIDKTARSKISTNVNKTSAAQLVDIDQDGKDDLYLTGFNGNVLFKNTGRFVFADATSRSKLGNHGNDCRGATWADVDNDGDLDVFLANFNAPSVILKNTKGVFTAQNHALGMFASENNSQTRGGIFLDFNNDSRIDLFVVKEGENNQLLKNVGGFQFANIASSAGVAFKGPGRGAVSADFNEDGFADIYLVNFHRPNKMYFNNGNETFKDVSASSNVGFSGGSQQAIAVDYDGDEHIDLFIVNSEGPSVLYRNLGNGKFQNATGGAGLPSLRKGRSATFSDFDRDGDYDLIFVESDGVNLLFSNNRGKFTRVSDVDLSNADDPSSTSSGDIDNDGDIDVIIGDQDGGPDGGDSVYQNTGGGSNNWITLVLQGNASNHSAIGAKVIVRTGLVLQAGIVSGGNGQNQDSLPLEFGLGAANSVDIIIFWPSGKQQSLVAFSPVNRKITIREEN